MDLHNCRIIRKSDQEFGAGAMQNLTPQLSRGVGNLCSEESGIRGELPVDLLPLVVHRHRDDLVRGKLGITLPVTRPMNRSPSNKGVVVRGLSGPLGNMRLDCSTV